MLVAIWVYSCMKIWLLGGGGGGGGGGRLTCIAGCTRSTKRKCRTIKIRAAATAAVTDTSIAQTDYELVEREVETVY